jgi:hypothetical protein
VSAITRTGALGGQGVVVERHLPRKDVVEDAATHRREDDVALLLLRRLLAVMRLFLRDVVRIAALAVLFQVLLADLFDRQEAALVIRHHLRAIVQADEDPAVHADLAQVIRHHRFARAVEDAELALVAFAIDVM